MPYPLTTKLWILLIPLKHFFCTEARIRVLYQDERPYTDPHKTPESCGAILKFLTTTGFWTCCQLSIPSFMLPAQPEEGS